jgi:hypothetical protein
MKSESRVKEQFESAIDRSIKFNEIVTIHLVDHDIIDVIACINTIDQIYDVDFANENDGAFDIWGMRGDQDWRLRIIVNRNLI